MGLERPGWRVSSLGVSRDVVSLALIEWVERAVAVVLLVLSLPVLGVLFVLHRLIERDGGSFIYRGERIGKYQHPFTIYKIRTLASHAEQELRGRLHSSSAGLDLTMGPFLRKTRLDEIPQLVNVICGDMALVGPRPLRRCVYRELCASIPGYDRRFEVRPGMTGLSQFLTPHSTSKAIRARIDRLLVRRLANPLWRTRIVLWTMAAVIQNTTREVWRLARRALRMRERECTVVRVHRLDGPVTQYWAAMPVDEHHVHIPHGDDLVVGMQLELQLSDNRDATPRYARCRGVIIDFPSSNGDRRVRLEPTSDFQAYRLGRHVFKTTVA